MDETTMRTLLIIFSIPFSYFIFRTLIWGRNFIEYKWPNICRECNGKGIIRQGEVETATYSYVCDACKGTGKYAETHKHPFWQL
jgi:hypothetical protein